VRKLGLNSNVLTTSYCNLHQQNRGGAEGRVVSRPAVYDVIYRRVPKDKILFNKRVLTIKDTVNGKGSGVTIVCSDSTEYEGDIIVGADGTNSSVRQNMYRQLKEQGRLPAEDDTPLPYNCICLVGQTTPLNLEDFPELKGDLCRCNSMCGVGNCYTVSVERTI
jgi:2-polyprenyl-6-methoxyphenol hydroxylase-like FAD-dependent oxidoreductase